MANAVRANKKGNWKINLKAALESKGHKIENAFQLWQRIGGSKETASNLYEGRSTMMKFETFDRLDAEFGITPGDLFIKA